MLIGPVIHPEILAALGRGGHGAKILISDGNYPHATASGPNAAIVYLNLARGTLGALDVLGPLVRAVPIEAATVMKPPGDEVPGIFADFQSLLPAGTAFEACPRFDFYDLAKGEDVILTIATGEYRTYANLLLTIGVVPD
ncbi:RbsD/FucU family protein [Actinocorallia lasiicapitis]